MPIDIPIQGLSYSDERLERNGNPARSRCVYARTFPSGGGATLRLHRSALRWDLLRAQVNVALAARAVKLRRFCTWPMARRVLLRTSVARQIEERVAAYLLKGAP
jgi:hypothetical protein